MDGRIGAGRKQMVSEFKLLGFWVVGRPWVSLSCLKELRELERYVGCAELLSRIVAVRSAVFAGWRGRSCGNSFELQASTVG